MLNGLPYQQYITYIEMMDNLKLELAAEYLVMVALLVEIKSRMLLPEHKDEEQEEEEPRAYLMCKLMAYEFIKNAADALDKLPREECDTFATPLDVSMIEIEKKLPSTQLKDLFLAFHDVLQRVEKHSHHHISREVLATRERMSTILENLKKQDSLPFSKLFSTDEGRQGVVISFLATLELCKEGLLDISQSELNASFSIRSAFS